VKTGTSPVLFIDTEMLFAETLAYQLELTERLRLDNVPVHPREPRGGVRARQRGAPAPVRPRRLLRLRKTEPLQRALRPYDLDHRAEALPGQDPRGTSTSSRPRGTCGSRSTRCHWGPARTCQDYIAENRLPRHPMVAKGYPVIGCQPCTTRVSDGEDPRAGRWRDLDKEECGIHFEHGKLVRGPAATAMRGIG
jgi:phosphoadenosine phosphosulfate reductase